MHEYTINKCAEMIERDRATIARALRKVAPDGGTTSRPLYRLASVVTALIAHEAKPDGRRGKGDEARLAAERARLAREQADAVALKNASARRENVPMALVQKAVEIVFMAFRERCLSIPGKIAASCDMRPSTEVEEIVRDEVYEALDELTRPILPLEPPPGWLDDTIGAGAGAADDDEVGHD